MTPQEREAAQMALDALEQITGKAEAMSYYCSFAVEIESLRAALAQPEQEPVAWMTHHEPPMIFPTRSEALLYCEEHEVPVPLYTAPPQREWVGLTDEEIEIMGNKVANENLIGLVPNFRVRFARVIEAKLKEKNGNL